MRFYINELILKILHLYLNVQYMINYLNIFHVIAIAIIT